MCGINGIAGINKDNYIERDISVMNNHIVHRGPDDDGMYIDPDFYLAMSMRRLSIIDLATGKQPFYSDDRKKILVFNGEIYNFRSLKDKLIAKGYVFNTRSDTEVILKMYEEYGVLSFNKLEGMFAFSLYDKDLDKVFIARDFFGEKPLYYTLTNGRFIWASELKSIASILHSELEISLKGLNLFFSLTYIPAPYSIYKNIYKLEANHYIELDRKELKYTILEIQHEFKNYENISKDEYKTETEHLIRESVILRSVSDVPLGTFLSGGVDSSIVSLCLSQELDQKIDTFSVGFEKKTFDETDKSRLVAKLINSNHHEYILKQSELSNNLSELLLNFDEPFADSSCIPTFLVSKMAREHVKVALTGDGGDEIFGGYNKYYMGKFNNYYTTVVPKRLHKNITNSKLFNTRDDKRGMIFKIKKFLKAVAYDNEFYFKIISLGFNELERRNLFKDEHLDTDIFDKYEEIIDGKINNLNSYRMVDKNVSLEGDLLVKVDRTSMLTSLECRSPLLNKELWNISNKMPEKYLINMWDKKHILKEAFKKYFPPGFLNKPKKGFGVPVGDWLRTDLKCELENYISFALLSKQGIFKINFTQELVQNHIEGKVDNTFMVWTFYCFQKWYVNNFDF